jgi:hypothetical protein
MKKSAPANLLPSHNMPSGQVLPKKNRQPATPLAKTRLLINAPLRRTALSAEKRDH